jgi:hypothetical protein
MKQCKVCKQELDDSKFAYSYHTLSTGERKGYKDSTCMACRRKKHLDKEGKREIHRQGNRNWIKNNPNKIRIQNLRKYGLTPEQYDDMRAAQKYKCALCEIHEEDAPRGRAKTSATALHIDHCHTTGKIRSLLCYNCNNMLGKAKDNEQTLAKAIEYLKEHRND